MSQLQKTSHRIFHGLFVRVAVLWTLVILISVGLGASLFIRQVRVDAWSRLQATGKTLSADLSWIMIQKLGDETEMILRCQDMVREGSVVRYIVLQPLSGDSIVVRKDGWSLEDVPKVLQAVKNLNSASIEDPWTVEPVLNFSRDINVATVPWGTIHFGLTLEQYHESIRSAIRNTLTTAAICSLVGLVSAAFMARRITRPLTQLSQFARRLASGDLFARADVHAPGEISELAESMNRMAGEISDSHVQLQLRAAREHSMASLSAAFLSNSPEQFDETITLALAAIATTLDATDAVAFLYDQDKLLLSPKWQWNEQESTSNHLDMDRLRDARSFPWPGSLSAAPGVYAIDAYPICSDDEAAAMDSHGLAACIVSVLGHEEKKLGYFLVASTKPRATWTVDERAYTRFAAGILTNAITRHHAELEREHLQTQLLQSQKMEAVGKLSGGIAHDFNNMLVPIVGYSDSILQSIPPGSPWTHEIKEIRRAAQSAATLTRQLLAFSRKQIMSRREINPNHLILTLKTMLHRLIGEDIQLHTHLTPEVWTISADSGQIEQCLVNLCVNARQAIPGSGQITLRTEMVDSEDASFRTPGARRPHGLFLRLSVQDTGCGMDEATMNRIFEPFYTTKGNDGTGLGLSVVHGIAEQHGGWVTVASELDVGTTFSIYLPALSEVAERTEEEANPPAKRLKSGSGQCILLVEDEEGVLAFVTAVLKGNGYKVITASNGAMAREQFATHQDQIQMILSDVVLPDASGVDLLEEFLSARPGLNALLSSGYSDKDALVEIMKRRGIALLHKPYTLAQLLEAIHHAMEHPPTQAKAVSESQAHPSG